MLAVVSGSFGARCFYVLFAALGWLLRVRRAVPLAARIPRSSFVVTRPVGAGCSRLFLCTFGGLLGVPLPFFAHSASSAHLLLPVSYPRKGEHTHFPRFAYATKLRFSTRLAEVACGVDCRPCTQTSEHLGSSLLY